MLKSGTKSRGVEISTQAIRILAEHPRSMKITVKWEKKENQFDPYKHRLEF
ncbi:MAG: ThaI family type II restriction endonuclease [Anaerolineales bacterium]|nr:ThaI family type II restriction endonuclease [Anaerolineales bacterium]